MLIIDFYQIHPDELKPGDALICTVVCYLDQENKRGGKPSYRLYHCRWPSPQLSDDGIPQGVEISRGLTTIANGLFPVLGYAGLKPDRF